MNVHGDSMMEQVDSEKTFLSPSVNCFRGHKTSPFMESD